MTKSSDQILRPLTLKYAIALGLLAALAAGNFFILSSAILDSSKLQGIVNQAGRQQTLLNRTVNLADRLVYTYDEDEKARCRREMQSAADSLKTAHYQLMSPATPRPLLVTRRVQAIYEGVPWLLDSEMRNYLLHLSSLVDAAPETLKYDNPHFVYVRNPDTIDKIRGGLDAVVDIYQTQSRAYNEQLQVLAVWAFGSTLLLLLLDGWFVFRPMVRQVRSGFDELDNLNQTLERRVADRTAEVERQVDQLARSESALRETEALYSSLVHHMPMSMLRKDGDGRFIFANGRFCELVGRPLAQIIGRTDADLYAPEAARKSRDEDRYVMETGTVLRRVEERRSADGQEISMEVLKVPLKDASGAIIGTQAMLWDVTDRIQAEQRALQAERLAAIGEMVTGVAHESRNALQQIQACSQLLKWELDDDDERRLLLEDLQHAEDRLWRILEELRSYAAPGKLDRRPCDLRDVVSEAWTATKLQRAGRSISLSEKECVVATTCVADRFQLEQVFRNLFENAIAACPDPVRMEVSYERVWEDDMSSLRVTVSDNGPGLTREQQSRIFEPFFTTRPHGAGLGLAIVQRIVDAHGGQVHAQPNSPCGAAFVITLPGGSSPSQVREPHDCELRTA